MGKQNINDNNSYEIVVTTNHSVQVDGVIAVDTSNTQEIRPNYYGGDDNVYEVFKVVEAWGLDKDAYLFNVIKYVARSGKKGNNPKEDLRKALTYLQRKIDNLD